MGEDGEWVTVQGRRRQRRLESEEDRVNLQGDKNPHLGVNQDRNIRGAEFNRVLKSKGSWYLFFTRFPEAWGSKELWTLFKKHGRVVDVYLANKRTRVGTRFGFVRFMQDDNPHDLEKKLNDICIGHQKLVINLVKYNKRVIGLQP
ncbi:nucleotide-binding alpha-beta plait domain-containing protein [Tanacetum coccineum]